MNLGELYCPCGSSVSTKLQQMYPTLVNTSDQPKHWQWKSIQPCLIPGWSLSYTVW